MPLPQNQTRKVEVAVERPEDSATRKGNVGYGRSRGVNVGSGNQTVETVYKNTSDSDRFLQLFTAAFDTDDYTEDFQWDMRLYDADNTLQTAFYFNPPQLPATFPAIRLQPEWQLDVTCANFAGHSVQFDMSVTVRGEVDVGES